MRDLYSLVRTVTDVEERVTITADSAVGLLPSPNTYTACVISLL